MATMISRSRMRIALVLLLLSLLLSGLWIDQARAEDTPEYRAKMLQLVNEARDQRERSLLRVDKTLSRYAFSHSRQMAEAGFLFHTPDLSSKLQGRTWSIGGENVGFASSLRAVMGNFMDSRLHRRNVLRTGYDHTAIGVVKSDGNLWVTVIFYG
jgi:uncharacterized protein YkwD